MAKKDYLEGAIEHFKHQETRIIEVPEWNLVGEDAIYVKPFTLIEKSEIFKGTTDNDLTVLIEMKRFVDPDIIGRIATQIMGNSEDTNTLKKN